MSFTHRDNFPPAEQQQQQQQQSLSSGSQRPNDAAVPSYVSTADLLSPPQQGPKELAVA